MRDLVRVLREGWKGFKVVNVTPGRFVWEENLTVHLDGRFVMFLKVFYGYGYYRPWVEAFEIDPSFHGDRREPEFYSLLYEKSPPLSKVFVEYTSDPETDRALRLGTPPELSRMGYLLLKAGYRNLRNWYYPEGLKEGGPKLQGEKVPEGYTPRDPSDEIRKFLKNAPVEYPEVRRAVERAEEILSLLGNANLQEVQRPQTAEQE